MMTRGFGLEYSGVVIEITNKMTSSLFYRTIDFYALCTEGPSSHLEVEFFTYLNGQRFSCGVWYGSDRPMINRYYARGNARYYFTANGQTPIFIGLPRGKKLYAVVRNRGQNINTPVAKLHNYISVFTR